MYEARPPKRRYRTSGKPTDEQVIAFRTLKAWERDDADLSPITPRIKEALLAIKAGNVILPRGRFEHSVH